MAKRNAWNTVTPLSKTISLVLFIAMPFIGFYLGVQYGKALSVSQMSTTPVSQTTTYRGKMPCADCSGIDETLMLKGDRTYTETLVYEGKSVQPFIERGIWKIVKGTPKNPNAMVYQLMPQGSSDIQNFLIVDSSHIKQLDKDLKEINAPLPLVLTKQ